MYETVLLKKFALSMQKHMHCIGCTEIARIVKSDNKREKHSLPL